MTLLLNFKAFLFLKVFDDQRLKSIGNEVSAFLVLGKCVTIFYLWEFSLNLEYVFDDEFKRISLLPFEGG
jgi:hypothetical protein